MTTISPSFRLLALGFLAAVATARADIDLTPSYLTPLPPNRLDVIGLAFVPDAPWAGDRPVLMSEVGGTWASDATGSTGFVKVFDPTVSGVKLNAGSLVVYDSVSRLYTFTGGTFDARFYVYSADTGTTLYSAGGHFGETMNGLGDNPPGLAVRNGTNDIFVSFGGASPALYRYTAGAGSQDGVFFGNTGPGAVSSGVGAMLFGPDGVLNVLDTGLQKILRYDPETLAYLGAISLFNTTTDNAAMVVSSTGYIFTANLNDTSGVIYDYLTGGYVGTFTGPSGDPNGLGNRVVMTADDAGNVYVANPAVSKNLATFSTSAVPEPATCGLLGAGALAGLAAVRRRKRAETWASSPACRSAPVPGRMADTYSIAGDIARRTIRPISTSATGL